MPRLLLGVLDALHCIQRCTGYSGVFFSGADEVKKGLRRPIVRFALALRLDMGIGFVLTH